MHSHAKRRTPRARTARHGRHRAESLELRTLLASPIVITSGGTYSGTWESFDAHTAAVTIATSEPVIIENSIIRSRDDCIESSFPHAKITVRNVQGYGLNPNELGRSPGRFFDVEQFDSVDIQNCYMESTAGIYMLDYAGSHTLSNTIVVRDNKALNIDGRKSNGAGGWLDFNERKAGKRGSWEEGMDLVQFLQFDKVRNVPGIDIAWNEVINEPGKSRVEDNINIYLSSGTPSSPMLIHDNFIKGAYTIQPGLSDYSDSTYQYDWSFSGGGILIGDGVSSTAGGDPGFIKAFNNQVVSTTNYGIAIAAGHDNEFYNNRVVSAGVLADGTVISQQNVGLYVWDSYGAGSSHFFNNKGHDNISGWVQGSGRNDWWTPVASNLVNNTHWPGTITLATEAAEYALWQQKLAAHRGLTAPDSLAASSTGISSIHLSWADRSNDESGFRVERSDNGVNGWIEITTTPADATGYDDSDLSINTAYYYRVRATNGTLNSAYTNIANATTDLPPAPAAPSDLSATSSGFFGIGLTWIDNADNETGFRVERSANGVDGWNTIATPAIDATTYSDTGLLPNTQYFYRVTATGLGVDSDSSNVDDATTDVLPPPAAPSDLVASGVNYRQIDLVWTDNADSETGFRIERSLDGIDGWTVIATPGADETTYSDESGLSASTQYFYRIVATNLGGDSDAATADATTGILTPPNAPTQLVATASSHSKVDIEWVDNSDDEDYFVIERSADGVNDWLPVALPEADATTYADTTVAPEMTYYYRVYASGLGGPSDFSNTDDATTPVAPPTAPTGLGASAASASQINLTWTDTSSNESGFVIQRSLNGTTGWTPIATPGVDATTYSDTPLTSNTTYYYRVYATGLGGDSAYTDVANAKTLQLPPAAPTNFNAQALSTSSIKLTWTDASNNETGFVVERSANGTTGWTQIATPAANATTVTDTGLTQNTTYFYRIRANGVAGNSDYVGPASTKTLQSPPTAPGNLVASAQSTTSIKLTWTDTSSNETGFIIERSPNGTSGWTQIATPAVNATTFTNTGLTQNTTYFFRILAVGPAGVANSPYSGTASATTLSPFPAAPGNLVAAALSASSIKLTWSDLSGNETGFRIERSTNGTTWSQIATVGANTTTYTNAGLSRKTKYYYRVVAYNAAGPSTYSNTASATTPVH